jgi:hypothetical protein
LWWEFCLQLVGLLCAAEQKFERQIQGIHDRPANPRSCSPELALWAVVRAGGAGLLRPLRRVRPATGGGSSLAGGSAGCSAFLRVRRIWARGVEVQHSLVGQNIREPPAIKILLFNKLLALSCMVFTQSQCLTNLVTNKIVDCSA